MDLVAGRECGECSVCCTVLNVDTPEFQKLPGKPCAHLCAQGCAIHETRFPVCRAYHCGWRYLAGLSEDWRPDKSGVLVDFQADDLPPHYPKRPGIRLTVFGPPEAALKPIFLDYVARLVASDVPVILAVPGPPAFFPAGALLNDALKEAVARRDLAGVQTIMAEAFKSLASHKFNPVVHRHVKKAEGSTADPK
ncbi:MAG TPA: hypothetical protein VK479_10970 [Micropepsaceae bacterium]|nr:hypothetical protein [Micropepsaceae bacterium]